MYRHTHGLSCDLKGVIDVMFTHGLDIELSVGLLPHFNFSAFRILPTIPHRFPHFSIPHFTFRIPHSAFRNSAFYQWPILTAKLLVSKHHTTMCRLYTGKTTY